MPGARWGTAGLACALAAFAATAHADEPAKEKTSHLEFRVVANAKDDADGLDAAEKYLKAAKDDAGRRDELRKAAEDGAPPPAGGAADKPSGYAWVEIGPAELRTLKLDEAADRSEPPRPNPTAPPTTTSDDDEGRMLFRDQVAKAREAGEAVRVDFPGTGCLFYSRTCQSTHLTKEEREKKKYDFFLLTRLPEPGKAVTGEHLSSVKAGTAGALPCVNFELDKEGGDRFYELTSKMAPGKSDDERFARALAVIVDGKVVSAPQVRAAIRDKGVITGRFTQEEIDGIVAALRSDVPKEK